MLWAFRGRDKVCKDCSYLLDVQIGILKEQQAGKWKQGDKVRNHWKQFIGERAQLNGMGLKFGIPLFWVICLSEAHYTQRLSVYIYVAILCWMCYMCGVAAGSKEYFSLSEMWKKPTFWLPHTCFPSVQGTIESHFKRASSHFSSANLWIWVMWCVFHDLVRRILQLWFK